MKKQFLFGQLSVRFLNESLRLVTAMFEIMTSKARNYTQEFLRAIFKEKDILTK